MATSTATVMYIERGERRSVGELIGVRHVMDPEISEKELRRFAFSEFPSVRRAAAYNPATPTDVLRDLALDANPMMRSAAEMSLRTR